MIEHDRLSATQLRAIKQTAEREIARIDRELVERPKSPALLDARADWAHVVALVAERLERTHAE